MQLFQPFLYLVYGKVKGNSPLKKKMKVSNHILKAMAISLTLGAATTSCSKVNIKKDLEEHQHTEQCEKEGCTNGTDPSWDNCPACGMG